MLNNLQAPIEQEEETKEGHLEDEMLRNIGVVNDWSNKSFDMLLELLKATFPMCNSTILSSFYEAKQKLLDLDDVLKHPVDDEGWKHFDSELPHLASNPRNVRLGLASDGFNPFGHKSAPYTLLWTINDFPAYGDLLKYKWGIRSRLHDGKVGRRAPPVVMNEHEIIEQLDQLKFSVMSKHPLYVRNKVRPEESIAEAYVMNELSTFCSSYLSAIETRFTRDERNDDTILDDEVIGEVENFEQKVRPSGMSSLRTLSREEKRLFHWYIFNNVDEILEFRKYYIIIFEWFRQDRCDIPLETWTVLTPRFGVLRSHKWEDFDLDRRWHEEVYFATRCSLLLGNGVCLRKTFLVHCLRWADIGREYIKHFFVLDFNDQAMNRFVQHQMLSTLKELGATVTITSKSLGWEPKPKTRKMASASSATTLTQSMVELQLWFELDEAKRAIEEHTRKQDMLASQVEQMWKVIEDMTPAQPRPPYDP
ncbi:CACTA en-spm transposon protein [Cucumis melo var. makuwa]|uniref:CACTA en-spm transposon protein n=1 Tax=Cucumis melo var. makuwa TaxID=1194695 RepID=A0A5D3BXI8_CUCMM|nr:CACTA en-spm transposon protein [Cucumis melo var. makuwa]